MRQRYSGGNIKFQSDLFKVEPSHGRKNDRSVQLKVKRSQICTCASEAKRKIAECFAINSMKNNQLKRKL